MNTTTPQVASTDGEQKTDAAKAGEKVSRIPWVDYDPISESMERESQAARAKNRLYFRGD